MTDVAYSSLWSIEYSFTVLIVWFATDEISFAVEVGCKCLGHLVLTYPFSADS